MVDPYLAGLFIAALIGYFLPTLVATIRHHHQQHAILALNVLLGWTGLGWIAAMIWAFVRRPPAAPAAP